MGMASERKSERRAAAAGTLAVDGGRKVWTKGFPAWPQFAPAASAHVLGILASGRVNYWTGDVGRRFESAFASWLGVRNAVSVSSGTAALHVALSALGVGPGDEVICPAFSFIASASCAVLAGATPAFVDVGEDGLIDPKLIEAAVTPRTKAIVVVHLYGAVADMGAILRVARRHGLFVVEDCAQCVGGVYRGRKAGTLGTVSCFSFCQSKHFTTGGEGGMVCCDDDALAQEARALRDHGFRRRIGYNYRLTEMQSAVGLAELARFDRWNMPRRRRVAEELTRGLAGHPLVKRAPLDTPARRNAFWLVPFVVDETRLACTAGEFVAAVEAEGASLRAKLWPATFREEAFSGRRGFGAANYPFDDPKARRTDYSRCDCQVAERLSGTTVAFWAHPTYSPAHARADVAAFRKVAAARMAAGWR